VEHVITNAQLANNVVLGNVSTLSPTPQIVDRVAVYALMSLAPPVFVSMGVDESMIFGFIISSPTIPRRKEYLHCQRVYLHWVLSMQNDI
jgi:hypothetical protein